MATSRLCLAHKSVRACRAFLIVPPYPACRILHPQKTVVAGVPKLRLSCVSFHSAFHTHAGDGLQSVSSLLSRRAFFATSSASSRKKTAVENPHQEIKKLDAEIRRLELERRSVGRGKNSLAKGKGPPGVIKGNRGTSYGTAEHPRNSKSTGRGIGIVKNAASSGGSRNANARALARVEQDEDLDDDEEDDDVLNEDDEELGEDFSSDADLFMETSDEEAEPEPTKILDSEESSPNNVISASDTDLKLINNTAINSEATIAEDQSAEVLGQENGPSLSSSSIKHPWKEWNDFYNVLAQKNYFQNSRALLEGEGYLRFQASAHMKHAIMEFSRERDDIIRFLTKKHLRTVINVGCPSTDRKVVNACKRLRVLCEIPEDEVCQQCKLKTFCTRAFAEPSPDLMAETIDVARVLYSFALNASPIAESQVSYPMVVVNSACHLIDEIVQLSAYPKDPGLPPLKSRLPVKPPAIVKKIDTDSSDSQHRAGDWNCPDCNFLNFSKNRECRECGTFRDSSKPLEPGDWECPKCTYVNFRRNKECRECLTSRPLDIDPGFTNENVIPGDWKCPKCHFVNFKRNSECYKCSVRRPKNAEVIQDDEDMEMGDWKCPQCKFKNFKKNKKCKQCGELAPEQSQKDDRWGLKKAAGLDRVWGSGKGLEAAGVESVGARPKHQEWKPDLKREMSDDSEDDLEEDADVVLGSNNDDDDSPSPSKASRGVKSSTMKKKAKHAESFSDFDFSDLDDKPSKKSRGRLGKESKDDDDEDDDLDMEDELSEGEDEDEDEDEDEEIPRSKQLVNKGRGGSLRKWNDNESDVDMEGGGFSDDDFDSGRGKGRWKSFRGGPRGSFGIQGGRGGRNGSLRGSHAGRVGQRGRAFDMGSKGRHNSSFSEISEDEVEFGRGGRGGGWRGRQRGGKRVSSFSESSGEEDFGRSGRGGGWRGSQRGGKHPSSFSESSGEEDFGRSGRGGGGRGSQRGGKRMSSFSEVSEDDKDFGRGGRGGGRRGSQSGGKRMSRFSESSGEDEGYGGGGRRGGRFGGNGGRGGGWGRGGGRGRGRGRR